MCREGKQAVRRAEGMGKADVIVGLFNRRDGAGYSAVLHAAAAASYACMCRHAAHNVFHHRAAVAPSARPAQATLSTSMCTIRPPGSGQTSPPLSAAPRPWLGAVMASRRRGASSTCTGAFRALRLVAAVNREGRAEGLEIVGVEEGRQAGGGHGAGWQAR
jgi:hypothetical protein